MSTMVARVRNPCSTALDSAQASAINALRQSLLILVELQLKGSISIISAFNTLDGANAVMQACCDLKF